MSSGLSRRGLFSLFGRSFGANPKVAVQPASVEAVPAPVEAAPKVAVIQGRFCLAYTSFCTVCSERCPVPGAIQVQNGIPMVVAGTCTGCNVCHEVCPAPTNAVLLVPRQRTLRFPPATAT